MVPILLVATVLLLDPIEATAAPDKCGTAIIKGSAAALRARLAALGKCRSKVVAGALPAATDCELEPTAMVMLTKARAKLDALVAKACGGADKTCGTADDDDLALAGWTLTACPDVAGGACVQTIPDCAGVAACVACIGAASVERALATTFDAFALATPSRSKLEKCQLGIGKSMLAFASAKAAALATCWQAVRKGKAAAPCPVPGDGKAAGVIAKAAAKLTANVCKACGAGGDKKPADATCDLPAGAFDPQSAIGFVATCPVVRVPGGDDCGAHGAITTLDGLIDCLTCVTEFAVDCADRSAVGALAAYPVECEVPAASTPTPAPTATATSVGAATATVTATASLGPTPLPTPSPFPDGESCTANIECAHGFCVDGVCCASACADPCHACDVPGDLGTCTPIASDPAVPATACDAAGDADNCEEGITECSGGAVVCTDPGDDDTTNDVEHCGGCGLPCEAIHTSTVTCAASACVPSCASPYQSCDGDARNGCEATRDTAASCFAPEDLGDVDGDDTSVGVSRSGFGEAAYHVTMLENDLGDDNAAGVVTLTNPADARFMLCVYCDSCKKTSPNNPGGPPFKCVTPALGAAGTVTLGRADDSLGADDVELYVEVTYASGNSVNASCGNWSLNVHGLDGSTDCTCDPDHTSGGACD